MEPGDDRQTGGLGGRAIHADGDLARRSRDPSIFDGGHRFGLAVEGGEHPGDGSGLVDRQLVDRSLAARGQLFQERLHLRVDRHVLHAPPRSSLSYIPIVCRYIPAVGKSIRVFWRPRRESRRGRLLAPLLRHRHSGQQLVDLPGDHRESLARPPRARDHHHTLAEGSEQEVRERLPPVVAALPRERPGRCSSCRRSGDRRRPSSRRRDAQVLDGGGRIAFRAEALSRHGQEPSPCGLRSLFIGRYDRGMLE